jgi:hypothetical protein
MLNLRIIQSISSRPTRLRFATPFYGMVSNDFVTDTTWLRDGVHLQFTLRSHCMQLLQPLIEKSAFATFSNNFYNLKDVQIECQSIERIPQDVPSSSFFRTWIRCEKKTGITLKNALGEFSLLKSFAEIDASVPYYELVLRKVR